jgi:hypothetical protein
VGAGVFASSRSENGPLGVLPRLRDAIDNFTQRQGLGHDETGGSLAGLSGHGPRRAPHLLDHLPTATS